MNRASASLNPGPGQSSSHGLLRGTKERQLTVYEKKFLLCAERGDVVSVKKLLQDHFKDGVEGVQPKLDINCTDPLGRSALILAVENENMELIEVLLKYKIDPGDALLHAISEEYVEAVELLLQHEERIHSPGTLYSWERVDHDTSAYTRDITPLILAAHKDNYEILKILLDRGAELPLPHDVKCACYDCISSINADCLRHSRSRINAYRALCSPSLISLSSRDPILTAFQLSWELRRLSKIEKEFALDYKELRMNVQNFAVALLDHVRNTHELRVILNFTTEATTHDEEEMKLERLKLAIDYKQKSFVSHPNVQQLLGSVWFEGMPGYRRKGPIKQGLQVASISAKFPLYALATLYFPNSKLANIARRSFIKFISHSASYLFFLFLLVLASQRVEFLIVSYLDENTITSWLKESYVRERGRPPNLTEWAIIIYIVSFIWQELGEFYALGIFAYVSDLWNIVDFLSNIVYVNWLGLRVLSYLQVQFELQESEGDFEPKSREDWDPYDPMLLSEGMFGAANICSFLKLVHIFSVHPHLGPLQISLGRMVFDILKFFFIFVLVLFAFGTGMNQLLWYYAEKEWERCKYGQQNNLHPLDIDHACEVWRRFANLFETSQTLFWASFGLIDLYNFELAGIKEFTRFWGLLMFGCYSVINVVVLLNLLIAMMSNSYNAISERSDTEWKFARSKLWISFFDETLAVPAPFNLLPPLGKLWSKRGSGLKRFPSTSSGTGFRETYSNVMRCLVRRYVTREQRKAEETGLVTEDDVNEIKQDIASFRYELIDMLKKNGMKYDSKLSHDDCFGKRERIRERRLLKGFNIGLVDSGGTPLKESKRDEHGEVGSSGLLNLLTNRASFKRRQMARERWTTALTAILKDKGNQIGVTQRRSSSLRDLREEVLQEHESTATEEESFDEPEDAAAIVFSVLTEKLKSKAAAEQVEIGKKEKEKEAKLVSLSPPSDKKEITRQATISSRDGSESSRLTSQAPLVPIPAPSSAPASSSSASPSSSPSSQSSGSRPVEISVPIGTSIPRPEPTPQTRPTTSTIPPPPSVSRPTPSPTFRQSRESSESGDHGEGFLSTVSQEVGRQEAKRSDSIGRPRSVAADSSSRPVTTGLKKQSEAKIDFTNWI